MTDTGPGWGVKIAFGIGAVANGVKNRSLAMFLMLFYNQVVGLDAALVTTIIMAVMVFDGLFDPLVGHISDNFRSRWGRRHPFMYAAALPFPLCFVLLWNPPAWSEAALAAYLFVVLVSLRFFDTLFELPTMALAPELTSSYDARVQITAIRALAGVAGAAGVAVLALKVFLKENTDGTGGVLAREGYQNYSIAAAIVIFSVIMICAVGTHGQIPRLSKPKAREKSPRRMAADIAGTFRSRAFIAVAVGGLLAAAATGMSQGLEMYWNIYLYRISQHQIAIITVAGVAASIIGATLATTMSKRFGKREAAIGLFLTSLFCTTTPLVVALVGGIREPGQIFWLLLPAQAIGGAALASAMVMMSAMVLDTVEQAELRTGLRSEGLILSVEQLTKKITAGVGIMGSGMILALAAFPRGAERHEIPEAVLRDMVVYFVPSKIAIFILCVIAISFYSITRTVHERNLAALQR